VLVLGCLHAQQYAGLLMRHIGLLACEYRLEELGRFRPVLIGSYRPVAACAAA
jgi:hypothetical protein